MPVIVDTEQVASAAGSFGLGVVQANAPRLWQVQVWPKNAAFYGPVNYSPTDWFALLVNLELDGSVVQKSIGGSAVIASSSWLAVGPRGASSTVYAKSVSLQLQVSTANGATIPAASPIVLCARIAPIAAPLPADARRLINFVSSPNYIGGALQLPRFTTEFRIFGAGPESQYDFMSRYGLALVDPLIGLNYSNIPIGGAWDWQPLHPYAAAIAVDNECVVEVR